MGKKGKKDKSKIQLSIDTIDKLINLKHSGDSYDDVIKRLLKNQ